MGRSESAIFREAAPKKRRAPQLWEIVDESGNRMHEAPIAAKTAAEAALYLIGEQKWTARKVEDGTP